MISKAYPTQTQLQELYTYRAGQLYRKKRRGKWQVGSQAGQLQHERWVISIDGQRYYQSVLIWIYHYGTFSFGEVDHKDRNKSNDTIENLCLLTPSENSRNRPSSDRLLPPGVYQSGKRFKAYYRKKFVGSFPTAEEAQNAYLAKQRTVEPCDGSL